MITRLTMTHEQARRTMDGGDLPADITGVSESVAVILTQSWCPQWLFMKRSIDTWNSGTDEPDLTVVIYEYDRSPLFAEFMAFKENTYRNWEVPYVRLFRFGHLVGTGNAMPARRMLQLLKSAVAV